MQVSFGDFVLDSDSRELRRGPEPVRLSPKALQLLQILATERPKALSKAELQNRLWPDTFVVEKNLANLISEIREALGEDRLDPRFIRTVPRYGYAFLDPAAEINESTHWGPAGYLEVAPGRACACSGGTRHRHRLCSVVSAHHAADHERQPDHAGRAAVPEPDRRSRTAVPLRRADRGDDRPSGWSRPLATWGYRPHVGDALQETRRSAPTKSRASSASRICSRRAFAEPAIAFESRRS